MCVQFFWCVYLDDTVTDFLRMSILRSSPIDSYLKEYYCFSPTWCILKIQTEVKIVFNFNIISNNKILTIYRIRNKKKLHIYCESLRFA
jgi:hypothetical protein